MAGNTLNGDSESPISAEEYRQRMRERAHPFIGHEGVGSRISIAHRPSRLVFKESFGSQIITIFALLAFGPGLTILMFTKSRYFLHEPRTILAAVIAFSLIGWIYATKYLVRLVVGRRIEVAMDRLVVSLIGGGRTPQTEVSHQEIEGLDLMTTWFHADSGWIENFTLRLKCRDGRVLELCTSDSRPNIDSVKSAIELVFSSRF